MGYVSYEAYRKSLVCKNCKTKAYRKLLCRSCYKREQKQKFHCTFRNCTCPVFASTLCQKHYMAWQTHCLYCNRMVHCRHLCRIHYRIALKNKEFPEEPICKYCDRNEYLSGLCLEHFKEPFQRCVLVECENNSYRKGLCCKHYFRERRKR
jgi:hypothetical protein